MLVEINIDCEDETELLSHLSVIRQQIKKEIKQQNYHLTHPATLEDKNCYGDHTVNIIPECCQEDEGHFPDGNGLCLSCGAQLGVEVTVK